MTDASEGPVRVLQIDTGREWRGGQQQVYYLTRELVARGHESIIVTPKKSPLAARAQAHGFPVREISYHGAGDPIAIGAIYQIIQDVGPSLLHTHTAHAHSLGFLVRRLPGLAKEKKPCLIVHRRVDFPPSGDVLTRMRYVNDPCVTYLCVSDAVREVLDSYGVARDRLQVVHSCIDPARVDAHAGLRCDGLKEELGLTKDDSIIGVVGAFVAHKGHRYLLEAMPRIVSSCPSAHVVFFGDGPLEKELRRQCWEKELQKQVTFAGFRPDVARFLHCFDLFAHPSTQEGLGTTILDAMAARLPVVASKAGGIPEVVRHGETGWLVPPAAPSELAGPIISLLQNRERREQFGQAGRTRLETEFSLATLCDSTVSAYRATIAARTTPGSGSLGQEKQKT